MIKLFIAQNKTNTKKYYYKLKFACPTIQDMNSTEKIGTLYVSDAINSSNPDSELCLELVNPIAFDIIPNELDKYLWDVQVENMRKSTVISEYSIDFCLDYADRDIYLHIDMPGCESFANIYKIPKEQIETEYVNNINDLAEMSNLLMGPALGKFDDSTIMIKVPTSTIKEFDPGIGGSFEGSASWYELYGVKFGPNNKENPGNLWYTMCYDPKAIISNDFVYGKGLYNPYLVQYTTAIYVPVPIANYNDGDAFSMGTISSICNEATCESLSGWMDCDNYKKLTVYDTEDSFFTVAAAYSPSAVESTAVTMELMTN